MSRFPSAASLQAFAKMPTLLQFSTNLGVTTEAMAETLLLIGIAASAAAILGAHHASIFFVLWLLYLSFVIVGDTFLSFQWDILLLEAGLLCALSRLFIFRQYGGKDVFILLFRFLFWKLMFMSGVVKLFSKCPTWLHLTALEVNNTTKSDA